MVESESGASSTWQCPSAHTLHVIPRPSDRWYCSQCHKRIQRKGSNKAVKVVGCDPCKYHLCEQCWEQKQPSLKCPSAHTLHIISRPNFRWYCSQCHNRIHKNEAVVAPKVRGCDTCKYHLCQQCFEQNLALEGVILSDDHDAQQLRAASPAKKRVRFGRNQVIVFTPLPYLVDDSSSSSASTKIDPTLPEAAPLTLRKKSKRKAIIRSARSLLLSLNKYVSGK
mmetsp:Transcript_74220/g.170067  ORF Transcript_74220/g.170067 Transcript_74220/m.170067 type:complete len:224 (+) Transcript_74220:128-799(+)